MYVEPIVGSATKSTGSTSTEPLHGHEHAAETIAKIETRTATVGVIGLGYVGLPLAVALGDAGFQVVGADLDATKVDALREGRSPLDCISDSSVARLVDAGRLSVTSSGTDLGAPDIFLICVPTPLRGGEPDQRFVMEATEALIPQIRKGSLVVLESTVIPDTTEKMLVPILEASGLEAETDFFVGFSPERVDPASGLDVVDVPKLVSGVGPGSTAATIALYSNVVKTVVPASSPRVAEFTKLLENTFRDVNIALVNELAQVAGEMGVNIWEAIDLAATKPYGFTPFYPGPGVGGHCIPVDPVYLAWRAEVAGKPLSMLRDARAVNDSMPGYVAERVARMVSGLEGKRILVLGAAFKRDIEDARNSASLDVMSALSQLGAEVVYHDPYCPSVKVDGRVLISVEDLATELGAAHCVVICTDHSDYDWNDVIDRAHNVFDTRNVLASFESGTARIERL